MARRGRCEVRCKCGAGFWVEDNDSRLPDGPFLCGTCDLDQWSSVAVFTGPAEMILVEDDGGSTLLDVLDSFRDERIRVVVYQRKREGNEIN